MFLGFTVSGSKVLKKPEIWKRPQFSFKGFFKLSQHISPQNTVSLSYFSS